MNENQVKRERGRGQLRIRGAHWQIRYYNRGGQRLEEVTEFSADEKGRRKAEALLQQRIGKVKNDIPLDSRTLRYDDLEKWYYLEYQTQKRKSLRFDKQGIPSLDKIKRLDDYFTGFKVRDIDADTILRFTLDEQKRGLAAGTINRSLAALKKMLRHAVKDGKLVRMPAIDLLPEAQPRQGFFEREQYDKLFESLPEFLRLPFAIAYFSGMRRGEVLGLTWDKIDFLGGVIRLPGESTKNGRPRIIPITPQMRILLEAQFQRRDASCSLVCYRRRKGRAQRIGDFRKVWMAALTKAGLSSELLWHDLRRSGVRSLVRSGVSQRVAREISGHRTQSVFDRYNIVDEADAIEAGRKVSAYYESQNGEKSGNTSNVGPQQEVPTI